MGGSSRGMSLWEVHVHVIVYNTFIIMQSFKGKFSKTSTLYMYLSSLLPSSSKLKCVEE